jgi:hypothetical protein
MDYSYLEGIYDSYYYSDGITRETWVDQEMLDVIICMLAMHVYYRRSPSDLLAIAHESGRYTNWSGDLCRFIPRLVEYNISEDMIRDN